MANPHSGGRTGACAAGKPDVTVNVTVNVTEKRRLRILAEIQGNPKVTFPDLSTILGVTRRTIARAIAALKTEGRLRRIGPDKGGHWEVSSPQ